MKVYFSPSNLAFYPEDFKKDYEKSQSWPSDANLVDYKVFKEYSLDTKPTFKKLSALAGHPVWIDDNLSESLTAVLERQWRDMELEKSDIELYKVQDLDPKSVGTVADWRNYRKALRSWPDNSKFPNKTYRPKAPDFKE
ncbi:MAG: phage tail assembly chaperone [Bacteroidales bacterium]